MAPAVRYCIAFKIEAGLEELYKNRHEKPASRQLFGRFVLKTWQEPCGVLFCTSLVEGLSCPVGLNMAR